MRPNDHREDRFARDVQQILRVEEEGIRWADNVGPVYVFSYLDADAPYLVPTPELLEEPLGVLCLAAADTTTLANGTVSGARVQWRWLPSRTAAQIEIIDVDIPTSASRYTVTLGVLRS